MQAFDKIGSSLKDRIVVRYISNFGEEEAGIDAGGLFKDFLTDLSRRIFDPSFVSELFLLVENYNDIPLPLDSRVSSNPLPATLCFRTPQPSPCSESTK